MGPSRVRLRRDEAVTVQLSPFILSFLQERNPLSDFFLIFFQLKMYYCDLESRQRWKFWGFCPFKATVNECCRGSGHKNSHCNVVIHLQPARHHIQNEPLNEVLSH